jgi:hypothetical protein
MIDAKMIRAIGRSSFFIADLAQHNPNVFWELGVRHAWKPTGTLLIAPSGTPRPPFDINHVSVHEYRRDADAVSDADAVAAIRALRPLVGSFSESIDSPVFAALPGLTPAVIPDPSDAEADLRVAAFTERIGLAADLHRIDDLRAEIGRLSSIDSDADRCWLLEQAGTALLDLGHPHEALEVLGTLAALDGTLDRPILQQRYALALMLAADGNGTEDLARLEEAERLLVRLDRLIPGSGETLGLLASIAKRRFALADATGQDGSGDLMRSIGYYELGFGTNPTDFYPGINAIALRVLRWRIYGTDGDAERARALVPVLRFMLDRPTTPDSVWHRAAMAELALYELVLDGSGSVEGCFAAYALAAAGATPRQIASMRKQLQLLTVADNLADIVACILPAVPET